MADRHLIDVHLLLVRGGRLLLSKRRGDEFDSRWHLPSGKLDVGEELISAMSREAAEEIGVRIAPADLTHVHVVHANALGMEPRIGHFFVCTSWTGEPTNCEPEKCYSLEWFDLDHLPEDIIDYPAAGIHAYRQGARGLSQVGWRRAAG